MELTSQVLAIGGEKNLFLKNLASISDTVLSILSLKILTVVKRVYQDAVIYSQSQSSRNRVVTLLGMY